MLNYHFQNQFRIRSMEKGIFISLLLATLLTTTYAAEWYQQGHVPLLDWSNFTSAIKDPSHYKFVKYFTHTCRYCRLLKQVEEQLMEQQQWPFKMYDVDCSVHYDLCLSAAQPTGFPYVGIYNLKGELEAKFAGYYPLDIMRDIFKNISIMQKTALQRSGIAVENKPQQKTPEKIEKIAQQPQASAQPTEQPKPVESKPIPPETSTIQKQIKNNQQSEKWSSVSQGIKILMVLFGYWMFDKLIRPYLTTVDELEQAKSRTIQIPVYSSGESAKAEAGQGGVSGNSLLMSDNV